MPTVKPNVTKYANWLVALLLTGCVLAVLFYLPAISPLGERDFRGYWSAAYLLRHAQNFADRDLIFQVQHTLAYATQDYAVMSWNPPWLLVMMLPYAFVSFRRAAWWWLVTNITMLFTSGVMVWQVATVNQTESRKGWVAPLVAFFFSSSLLALFMGQVNILVLMGISAFLYWQVARPNDSLAGGALILTLVKPHLVYITVPLLLLRALYKRQWRLIGAFAGTLLALTAVAFLLRPTFLTDYLHTTGEAKLLAWATPTLGSVLELTFGWHWARLMGVIVGPLVVVAWWWRYRDTDTLTLVSVTLLLSILTTAFGWSYDFVVLLVPVWQLLVWAQAGELPRGTAVAVLTVWLVGDALSFYQRVLTTGEQYFVWIPLLIVAGYTIAWWQRMTTLKD